MQQLCVILTPAGDQHAAGVQIVLRSGRRLPPPELTQNIRSSAVDRQVPMIEQWRLVANSQIFRRPAAAVRVSSVCPEILRSPSGRTATLSARKAPSFEPKGWGWLNREPSVSTN